MKEKIKSMNLIQIISNILMLITVIGSIFFKDNIKDVMISLLAFSNNKYFWTYAFFRKMDKKRH